MLTNFFEKSKPVNFLLVGLCMSLSYCAMNYLVSTPTISVAYIFKKLGLLLVYLLLMILVNFIVKRNRVNKPNTYAILLFALFTMWFPDILQNGNILLSGFFVLLAFRRIISLKSGIDLKKKIFDASFWIFLASLFFQMSLFFLLIVFLAILFYAANDYRNWIVPILASFVVFILATCFSLLVSNSFLELAYFFEMPSWNFEPYNSIPTLIPLAALAFFSLLAFGYSLFLLQNASANMKSSMSLILAIWFVALLIVLSSAMDKQGELLFFIIPTAIIGANYFQNEGKKIWKEVVLLLLVGLSISFLFY